MTLAGVYSFWKYVSKLERRETRRYLEMFYILKYRDLVSDIVFIFLNLEYNLFHEGLLLYHLYVQCLITSVAETKEI